MPREPDVSFSEQAARALLGCSRTTREQLLKAIEHLQTTCHEPAEITVKDASGRDLSVSQLRQWTVTWWLDPADWELRILRIEKFVP
jgi:hypothetical protein